MGWSMTKPKRKKKRKPANPNPLEKFRHIKGPKRVRLIAERKAKGLTQTELAKIVGCSTSLISHFELGRVEPNKEMALALENYFGVPFVELFPEI